MIRTKTARRIAADWHGGQSSPLYSFASTGRVWSDEHKRNLIAEINACKIGATTKKLRTELDNLREYVESYDVTE